MEVLEDRGDLVTGVGEQASRMMPHNVLPSWESQENTRGLSGWKHF